MRKALTVIECIILAIGVLLSITGTVKVTRLSSAYMPYFLVAALGVAFIVILIVIRKKRFAFLVGIGFIVFYLFFAGFAFLVCEVNASRIRTLNAYKGKEIWLTIGEDHYRWNGEASYDFGKLEPLDVRDQKAYLAIDDEKREVGFIYVMPGDDDTAYYEIHNGYLVMEKDSNIIYTDD